MATVYERLKGTIESEFAVGGPAASTKLTAEATNTAAKLALAENAANGAHTVSLQAPSALAGSITLTLPATDGAAAGYDIMQSNGSGALTFTDRRIFDRIRVDAVQGKIDTTTGGLTLAPQSATTNVTGAMIISGNLTVQGSTTTVESTNLSIEDSIIELARGNDDGSAGHIGMKAERGSAGDDAYMVYVEGDDRWHAMTSADGSSFTDTAMQASAFHGALTGNVTGNVQGNVTGNVTGQVSTLSNHNTGGLTEGSNLYYTAARWDAKLAAADSDDLSEGSTNLYHTTARARASVSVTDAGGDGSCAYNSSTGVITYTGPTASETRAHFSVTDTNSMDFSYSSGAISANAKVDDSSIEIDASNGMQVKASGITNAMLAGSIASAKIANLSTFDTDGLAEGSSNLYHTNARARAAVSVTDAGGDGSLAYNNSTGVLTYTGPGAAEVRAHFSAGEGIDISSGAISAEDATDTNKGVASFASADFAVSSGAVTVKAGGISNAQLAGSIASAKIADLSTFTTAHVAEGSNLYYSDERVDDRVATLVVGGNAVSSTYDDAAGTLTLAAQVDNSSIEINSDAMRIKAAGVTDAMLAGSISNAKLANSTVSFGGVSLALGASDATPAFDLQHATGYAGDSALTTVGTVTTGTWQGTAIDGDFINIDACNTAYAPADFMDTDFMLISDGGVEKKVDLATLLGNTERVVKLEIDASSANIAGNASATALSSKLLPAGSMITRVLAQVGTAQSDLTFEVGRSASNGSAQASSNGETDLFFDDLSMGATGTYVEQQITTSSASGTRKLQLTVSNSSGSTVTAGKVTCLVFFTEMPAV
tara:strand:+ start:19461 stop:21938 length:2478 start_codon:yes stop_codon:yes gene_type:complete